VRVESHPSQSLAVKQMILETNTTQHIPGGEPIGSSVRSTINDSRCSAIHRAISLFAAVFLNPRAKRFTLKCRLVTGLAALCSGEFLMVATRSLDWHCGFNQAIRSSQLPVAFEIPERIRITSTDNDPAAGSPTATLLRLLLPLVRKYRPNFPHDPRQSRDPRVLRPLFQNQSVATTGGVYK
jgi:hypothetical protein